MANPSVRINLGRRPRDSGSQVGVSVSTFGLDKLIEGVTGQMMAEVGVKALQVAYEEAQEAWPVQTGASKDSMEVVAAEVGSRHARVRLQVGGQKLISDPRNKSHRDYAPFIEFNGTATAPAGIIRDAIYLNDREIKEEIRQGLRDRIERHVK